jgi:L-ascorbate metabolism protein UlaG (beta-lactamase superfamily)
LSLPTVDLVPARRLRFLNEFAWNAAEDLGPIDAILLTHDHHGHQDPGRASLVVG